MIRGPHRLAHLSEIKSGNNSKENPIIKKSKKIKKEEEDTV